MSLFAAMRPRLGLLAQQASNSNPGSVCRSFLQGSRQHGVLGATQLSTAAAIPVEAPASYSKAASWLHWIFAAGFVTCITTVQASMNSKDNAFKGQMMTIHKSTGVLLAALAIPRVLVRLTSAAPGPVPGSPKWEQIAANLSHYALYVPAIVLPGSGVAMGILGGKGLPFYGLFTIPGAEPPNGAAAKTAFGVHKQMGQVVEYGLLPLHLGGAGVHVLKGTNIFKRINPFA